MSDFSISSTCSIRHYSKVSKPQQTATMKFLVAFGVLCLVALSTQTPLFEGCDENIQSIFKNDSCFHVKCQEFNKLAVTFHQMTYHQCFAPKCKEGTLLKGQNPADVSKVYPHCCATPICEEPVKSCN
ncbi:uncharacterized protein LOC107980622 [Nasonia vitripennis]|uniref:Uncharacterized protein n=1 Tax=Nasonia vitripennis TaxID=7425 RepID=A0A7M7ILH6_NASVI|nr:uncharacterized protein LOC107980622 [Nasonia vitripennis]